MAARAAAARRFEIRIVYDQTGTAWSLDVVYGGLIQEFFCFVVIVEREAFLLLGVVSIFCSFLECHSELRSGATHACKINSNAVTLLFIFVKQVLNETNRFSAYFYH